MVFLPLRHRGEAPTAVSDRLRIATVVLLKEKRTLPTLLPLAALIGVFLITTHVSYQVGVRHVLLCLPLMAITTAAGLKSWTGEFSWRSAASLILLTIVGWQLLETARAQQNLLAYFNEVAGRDPGRVLSLGCDFDCGQDLYALANELLARHVARFKLAIWTSADVDRSGLPPCDLPDSDGRAQGWVAISSRAFLCRSLPPPGCPTPQLRLAASVPTRSKCWEDH